MDNKFSSRSEDIRSIFEKAKRIKEEQKTSSKKEEIIATDSDESVEVSEPSKVESETKESAGEITLTGIHISPTGELTKTGYFDMISVDPERYSDIKLSPEEAEKVSKSMRRMSTGINSAIPMTCAGDSCSFASTCPYVEVKRAPVGRPCLVEAQLVEYWTKQFIEEFEVDPNNITELHLVSELAEFNIYEKRVTQYLAENHPTLMQWTVSGFDNAGNAIENQEISRAFDLKERIKRNRMKVLDSLMATRKEKVKLKLDISSGTSTAERMSDLKNKVDSLKRDISKMNSESGTVSDAEIE